MTGRAENNRVVTLDAGNVEAAVIERRCIMFGEEVRHLPVCPAEKALVEKTGLIGVLAGYGIIAQQVAMELIEAEMQQRVENAIIEKVERLGAILALWAERGLADASEQEGVALEEPLLGFLKRVLAEGGDAAIRHELNIEHAVASHRDWAERLLSCATDQLAA